MYTKWLEVNIAKYSFLLMFMNYIYSTVVCHYSLSCDNSYES